MKNLFLTTILTISSIIMGFGQADLTIKVRDGETSEPVPFTQIILNDKSYYSDLDGKLIIRQHEEGTFVIQIRCVTYPDLFDTLLITKGESISKNYAVGANLSTSTVTQEDEQIVQLPKRDIRDIQALVPGVNQSDSLTIRGSCGGNNAIYYVDGVVFGSKAYRKQRIKLVRKESGRKAARELKAKYKANPINIE